MATYHYRTQVRKIMGDLYTPVNAYMKVRDAYPQSFLMESADYHGEADSHSYIGFDAISSVQIGHGKATMRFPNSGIEQCDITAENDVATVLTQFINEFGIEGEGKHHFGLYGFTSFNAVKYFEPIEVKDSTAEHNDAPDILYTLFRYVIVFNHYDHTIQLLELVDEGELPMPYNLDKVEHLLNNGKVQQFDFVPVGAMESTLTDDEHRDNIRQCIAHCMRGDVFQIVVSRRFIQHYKGDDFKLYRALRSINPSPYLFYFDFGGYRIFGSSPETHYCAEGGQAFIDPIAGTTRRTGDPKIDTANAEALRQDPKENAEHTMLVDLARNDLSRACSDVHVERYKELHYFSHVIHLVSRVRGKMKPEANPIRAFIDTFPAGTLSGAPKVRAMQLISAYEPHNRGAYGGCIGKIGLNGDMVHAIVIRTFVSRNNALWFQAGGGIVAKSDVEAELQEVNNKLGALRRAIDVATQL